MLIELDHVGFGERLDVSSVVVDYIEQLVIVTENM
jgi:hypothetical protein